MLFISTIYTFYGSAISIYLYGRKTIELFEEMKENKYEASLGESEEVPSDNASDL
jgi:hypothetical protein